MTNNTKYVILGALAIVVLVYVYGRKDGKTKGKKQGSTTYTAPGINPAHIDPNLDVEAFAEVLANNLLGWWPDMEERFDALTRLYNFNDSEFKAVYNAFNANHGNGQSLRQIIGAEWALGPIADKLEIRFNSLNME